MSSSRIPSLDGIRAVAVLLVLLGHAAHDPTLPQAIRGGLFFDTALFGVSVFFVLSGFLITTLLNEEISRTGTVSLRNFYLRRSLRIFPAAYFYVLTVALLAAGGLVVLRDGDLLHAFTYTMNYHHLRAWPLGHLWSLAVEEQFYLLWPLAFLLCGQRRALGLAIGVIAVIPVLRVISWIEWPSARIGMDEEFQFVCDGLATGCALALFVARHGLEATAAKIPTLIFVIAPFAAVACSAFHKWPSFSMPIGVTATNLAIGISVLWCIARPNSLVGRALNCRPLVVLGTLSYSLYVWQQLFMIDASRAFPFPKDVILALSAAIGSFYLLERPMQGLRQRFRR